MVSETTYEQFYHLLHLLLWEQGDMSSGIHMILIIIKKAMERWIEGSMA